jgi:N-methylhydantoinase B
MDAEIFAIISSNIRFADQRIGDIKAQAAALMIGETRLMDMLARYGCETLDAAIAEIRARSAERMRAEIRTLPDESIARRPSSIRTAWSTSRCASRSPSPRPATV